jgi:hypothetical protein
MPIVLPFRCVVMWQTQNVCDNLEGLRFAHSSVTSQKKWILPTTCVDVLLHNFFIANAQCGWLGRFFIGSFEVVAALIAGCMTPTFRRNVLPVFAVSLTLVTWGYSVLSKRRDPITPWRSVVFQRNGMLLSSTVMRGLVHPKDRNWFQWVLDTLCTGIWFILHLRTIMGIF